MQSLPSADSPPYMVAGYLFLLRLQCAVLHSPRSLAGDFTEQDVLNFNKPFMILYALVAIVGATMNLGLMWNIAETFNGLMVIPNLIAVFLLSGVVVKLVKEYFEGEGKTK